MSSPSNILHYTLIILFFMLFDKNADVAAEKLEEGLCKLSEWCIMNKLTVNVKNTKPMVIVPARLERPLRAVTLNDEKLDTVRTFNYLAVDIDDCLTFENFLKHKCNKVNVKIYQLHKLPKYVSSNISCLIYKQTMLPVVEYADIMSDSGPTEKITKLQKLQDKVLYTIDNGENPNLDADQLSINYRILPLKLRREEHLSSLMYRLSKNVELLESVRPDVHLRNRNKIRFRSHKGTYEKYLKSPMSHGITMWDLITEAVQRSTTKVKFKKGINSILPDLVRPVMR